MKNNKEYYVLTSKEMRDIEEKIERLNDKLTLANIIIDDKNSEIEQLKKLLF